MNRIWRAVEFIKSVVGTRKNIGDAAKEVGMSRHHFARRFKAATGMTPTECAAKARVDCVKCKLMAGATSLAIIAFTCGYASQAHMTTAFRRATGMTPGKYRRWVNSPESQIEQQQEQDHPPPAERR